MAELDLDAILALADAADAAPWTTDPSTLYVHNARGEVVASFEWLAQTPEEWAQLENNAKFTAAARTDVPALVAEVRRLRGAITRARQACEDVNPRHLACKRLANQIVTAFDEGEASG